MNLEQIFKEALMRAFESKRSIGESILKEITNIEYDNVSHTLKIDVSKPYAKTLLKSNSMNLKDIFENVSKLPVKQFNINDEEIRPNFVREVDNNEKSHQKNLFEKMMEKEREWKISLDAKNIDNYKTQAPNVSIQNTQEYKKQKEEQNSSNSLSTIEREKLSSNRLEKTISESIKTKFLDEESEIYTANLKLTFYNKYLGSTKTVIIDRENLEYKNDFIIAGILFFTIVIPLVFLGIGWTKKKQFDVVKKDVISLLKGNYNPVNKPAKEFVEKFIIAPTQKKLNPTTKKPTTQPTTQQTITTNSTKPEN